MSEPETTGAVLIAFRRELIDAGWPDDLVHEVTRNAADHITRINGLVVKP